MRKILFIISILIITLPSFAQKERITDDIVVMDISSITDEQLDTIDVRKKLVINDYSMIGIQYGAGLSRVMWSHRPKQDMVFIPMNIGITFTTYGKMFGYMPSSDFRQV